MLNVNDDDDDDMRHPMFTSQLLIHKRKASFRYIRNIIYTRFDEILNY